MFINISFKNVLGFKGNRLHRGSFRHLQKKSFGPASSRYIYLLRKKGERKKVLFSWKISDWNIFGEVGLNWRLVGCVARNIGLMIMSMFVHWCAFWEPAYYCTNKLTGLSSQFSSSLFLLSAIHFSTIFHYFGVRLERLTEWRIV